MTQTQDSTRSRTFSWSDPAVNAAELGRRSGLETLRATFSGELPPPPVSRLLDMSRMTVDEGLVTVEMVPQEFHYNPLGSIHGGILSTLLDTAAGCAVHSTLPAGVAYTSLDLNVKFLRPATVDSGTLVCVGTVLQRGRRTALAEARITDADSRLIAHATSTCLIFPVTPAP
ncbi:PaaI family thioesterase [Micromonospora musae]|uniref:PaaI family thioesterase n=1 Tax=Micromonospora musae TaxID=1894970 RepID=A0A3A9YLS4_9ACTN|nr:PaaI family thioesterase [Micromonospora musae]RKN13799.1 PaaI family thioesterase [Micromonospora musae]RKN35257.1 PaaI family thioesterase [Micromonospora musae]